MNDVDQIVRCPDCLRYVCRCPDPPMPPVVVDDDVDWTPWMSGRAANA